MKENIIIRYATPEDAPALLAIYAPYVEETAITFEYTVPTVEEFAERIRNTMVNYPYLVAEQDDEILGYAYAGKFKAKAAYDWAVETTIYIDKSRKRAGLGRLLYEELEKQLARQGILNLYACIAYPETEDEHLTNDSVLFHEKLGYRMIGTFYQCGYKFNRWYHMVWMEKMLGEHKADQPEVVPFSKLV